jgi:molybdopterin synthase catalytic subunit
MRPASAAATDRSAISGGYTKDEMLDRSPDRFAVTAAPLDPAAVAASVSQPDCGAVATFVGLVRDHNAGRRVLWLEYEAYATLARTTFARIGDEAAARWPAVRLAIHHRTGRIDIGEASVVIAAASPHRGDAFAACRYAIERVKQIAPVWKHEHCAGGDVWIEGATADPDDAAARQAALARACT